MHLYGELTQLQSALEVTGVGRSPSLLRPMEDRVCHHVTQSSKLIGECCQSLLCFSLLVPSAPLVGVHVHAQRTFFRFYFNRGMGVGG